MYLGEKQHDDSKLITDSHHDILASVAGRYDSSCVFKLRKAG